MTTDTTPPTPGEPDEPSEPVDDGLDPNLTPQRCVNCGSTQLTQDTNGLWHCGFCRSTFRADDPAMIVVDSAEVRQANENVVDTADMLTFDQQQALGAHLRGLGKKHDVVVVVETVNTITQNVEYYARSRAHELGVGDEAKDNGLYILLVRQPRRIQVQAGNGISNFLNGDDINAVVSSAAVPHLKSGDIVSGLMSGADGLVEKYLDNKAMNNVRTASRASGGSRTGSTTRRSMYSSNSSRNEEKRGKTFQAILMLLFFAFIIWMLMSGGFSGSGGGGSGGDSGYDSGSGWDSGGGGGWDSGGGSDYGGGGFDSGSGGGSDW